MGECKVIICSGECGRTLPATLEFFYREKRGKHGLRTACKRCHRKTSREYGAEHRGTFRSRLYSVWSGINSRCNNPKLWCFKYYGGKGVKNLFTSFEDFFIHVTVDMGYDSIEKLEKLQIHRINNNGHYEPGNIVFLTRKEHGAAHHEINRLRKSQAS